MGAWDHPSRSHKRFIDIHCQANAALRRQFLPGHLGWWAVKTWTGPQGEPTFADDIEYLCGKCASQLSMVETQRDTCVWCELGKGFHCVRQAP